MDLLFRLVAIFCITAGILSGVLAIASVVASFIDEDVADCLLDSSIVSLKCTWFGILVYVLLIAISNMF